VVSQFEWVLIALLVGGVVLPNAAVAFALVRMSRRSRGDRPSMRFFAYAQLLAILRGQLDLKTRRVENGPLFIATVRELKQYPEYRALSLLFIEEITITGSRKFDDIARTEIQSVENDLLDSFDVERG